MPNDLNPIAVTDPHLDAPAGATVVLEDPRTGAVGVYERHGASWEPERPARIDDLVRTTACGSVTLHEPVLSEQGPIIEYRLKGRPDGPRRRVRVQSLTVMAGGHLQVFGRRLNRSTGAELISRDGRHAQCDFVRHCELVDITTISQG